MTLESTIEDYFVKRIIALGGRTVKLAVPSTRFIDRLAMLPNGVSLYAELKRPKGGRKSPLQVFWIRWLIDNGHVAGFAATKEEVDQLIERALRAA